MANPKKLPKWAIKQAGGINKKAWALARRGRGKKAVPKKAAKRKSARKRSKSVAKKGNPNRAPKMGAVLKGARAVDTISAPAQGVLALGGGPQDLISRYSNKEAAMVSAKGAGVGLVRNAITSKSGAYRGIGQNKILSYVQVLAPEITAAGRANPVTDPAQWNRERHRAHEGYEPVGHDFDLNAVRDSAVLQGVAWGAQKVIQKLGINRMLPKGWNF